MPRGKTGRKKLGRPPRGKSLSIKQIGDAIRKSGGFISIAAESLGITVAGVSQRIKKSTELQIIVEDIDEKYLDLAESKLIANIKANDQRAIEFYIRHKGRRRGYISTDSHIFEQGGDGNPFELKVIWAK